MPSKLVARTSAYFVLLLAGLAWLAVPALADDKDKPSLIRFVMPDVKGKRAEPVIEQLEELGLDVFVLTVASPRPGLIDNQDPKAGTVLNRGDEVVIYVGIELLIQTIAPDVRGRREEDVGALLDEAYLLDVKYVRGTAAWEGKVIAQQPRPGMRVPYRGRFQIQVVRRPIRVPALVGKFLPAVESLMADIHLELDVRFMRQSAAQRGLVLSQDPRPNTELMPGEVLTIRVAGPRPLGVPTPEPGTGFPPDHDGHVPDSDDIIAPDLIGMGLYDAQAAAIRAGFVPHIGFLPGATRPEMIVAKQQEQPGSRHAAGAHLHFSVWKRDLPPNRIQVPSLYGLDAAEAAAMLENVGLRVEIRRVASALEEGTIFQQSPAFGTEVPVNTAVSISVASVLPDGLTVDVVVPNLRGMDIIRAREALVRRGLTVRLVGRLAPNQRTGIVFAQDPAPGTTVAGGSRVRIFVPKTTIMPSLMDRSVQDARRLLTDAGLQGDGSGPALGVGTSRVVSQAVPAGTVVARGSTMEFRYVFGATASTVLVPNVRGKQMTVARQALAQVGLTFRNRSVAPIRVGDVVVSQTPAAGTRVARGSVVSLLFGRPTANRFVIMPNTIGQSRDASVRQLTGLGLSVRLVGRVVRGSGLKVTRQSVVAGTRIAVGSTVTLTLQR